MSDEGAKKEEKPAAPPKAKTSKAMLGLLLMNLGATGFVTFKMVTAQPAEAAPAKPVAPATQEVSGPVVGLDPFVVNLDEPGTSRYLKITLELELFPEGEAEATLTKSKQLVRDSILSHLSGLHVKDTLGAEAKDKIRADLMASIVKLLGPDKVRRMFFQEFVIQ